MLPSANPSATPSATPLHLHFYCPDANPSVTIYATHLLYFPTSSAFLYATHYACNHLLPLCKPFLLQHMLPCYPLRYPTCYPSCYPFRYPLWYPDIYGYMHLSYVCTHECTTSIAGIQNTEPVYVGRSICKWLSVSRNRVTPLPCFGYCSPCCFPFGSS